MVDRSKLDGGHGVLVKVGQVKVRWSADQS